MNKKVLRGRKRVHKNRVAIVVIALVLLLVICAAAWFLLHWLSSENKGSEPNNTGTSISSSVSEAVSSQQTVSKESSLNPEDSSAAVSLPPSSGVVSSVEFSMPESSDVQSQASGSSWTEDYFANACFIGDSRTEGLRLFGTVPSATFYSAEGLAVNTIFTQPVVTINGRKLSVTEALKEKSFEKIYIMFGVNELGWPVDSFIRSYENFIKTVKEIQPNATIYIQNIFPVTANKSRQSDIYTNANIRIFNGRIKAMAQELGVKYVDLYTYIGDKDGNLPVGVSPDGVHLEREYCEKWVDYLRKNGDR